MKLWLLLLSKGTLLFSQQTLAAACCGGGVSAPSLIVGDQRAQLTSSYSFSEVVIDNVDSKGVWRKWEHHQQVETLKIEGAHLISDRWQAGFSLPLMKRTLLDESYSGVGDTSASLGYEYLPDWNYHPIRPKGTGFLQLTLPTGKARAESDVGGLDSRGNGFWSLGLGTLLTKSFGKYDALLTAQIHHSFSKKFSNSSSEGTLNPGLGGSFGLGGGYNLRSWRFGSSITWVYEDPVDIEGSSPSQGSHERYATGTLSASYLYSDSWAATMTYSDQTIFGDPVNTSLGRTIAMQLQRRWER